MRIWIIGLLAAGMRIIGLRHTGIRIFCLLAAGLLTGYACSNDKSIPSGILSQDKMTGVLWDMIEADQYAQIIAKDTALVDSADLNLKLENLRLYEQVFQLHHVTRDEFHKSYKYYMDHPDLTQVLFDSLITKGNRLRSEAYSRPAYSPPAPVRTLPHPQQK